MVHSSTACVRKQALLDMGGFPTGINIGEDVIVWMELARFHPVAHSNTVTATYNQDATNRTNTLREHRPPESLRRLGHLIKIEKKDAEKKKALIKLFHRIAFFTAAGFCLEGFRSGAKGVAVLAWRIKRYFTSLAIVLLFLTPRWALKIAKHYRHKNL